jgi:hypothetical protein
MYSQDIIDRFWEKVEKLETGLKCWEWKGYLNKGYGRPIINGKSIYAHRFSFQLKHNRLINEDMSILHSCDNPKCVNPDHLSEGTHADNMADMKNKGRQHRGEASPMSMLTNDIVLEIRAKYAKGDTTHRKLAEEYGISHTTVGYIINRIMWHHI